MLRILQITNKAVFPADDGSSIAVLNMALGLHANGVNVHLLAINTSKHFKADEKVDPEFQKTFNYKTVYRDTNPGKIGAFMNLFSSESYFISRFRFAEFEQALQKELQTNTYDIIQLEGLFMGVYLDTIRKFSKAKIVLRAHNVEYLIWQRHIQNENSSLKKWYLRLQTKRLMNFERRILNSVDAIVSITDVDKHYFSSITTRPLFSCITGVDVAQYNCNGAVSKKPKTVFYFASMDWLPNQQAVDWFLDNCWQKIATAVPDATFIVAGKNMPVRFTKISLPNVRAITTVSNAKEFFCMHDILVVPLLSGSGLRIKIIEGMAYGKAIVSTSIGAEGILAEAQKDILIEDDPDAFSNAVIRLLNNSEFKQQVAGNAGNFAKQHFDNKQVVAPLIEFYRKLNV